MCEVTRRGDGQVVHVDPPGPSGAGDRYAFRFSRGLWAKLLGIIATHLVGSSLALGGAVFLFWHQVEKRHALQIQTDKAQDREIGENAAAIDDLDDFATSDDVDALSRKLDKLGADFYELRGEIRGLLLRNPNKE